MATQQAITRYTMLMTDRETPSTWMRLCSSLQPRSQDSGRCRFDVATQHAEELEAALESDDDVIEYVEVYGELLSYDDASYIRQATREERDESRVAAQRDGGAGVIRVDGLRCYVQE